MLEIFIFLFIYFLYSSEHVLQALPLNLDVAVKSDASNVDMMDADDNDDDDEQGWFNAQGSNMWLLCCHNRTTKENRLRASAFSLMYSPEPAERLSV